MSHLVDPVPRSVAVQLRAAVALLHRRTAAVRSRFPSTVSVGHIGRDPAVRLVVDAADALDHGARSDVVSALIERALPETHAVEVRLERRGEIVWNDEDAGWLAAASQACAEHGRELTFVVLTRHGWYDPRGGAARRWVRPRVRQSQV